MFRKLVHDAAGRAAIMELAAHPDPWVRVQAAGHVLMWAPEVATPVLEGLANGRGLFAISAEYTLREYRAGRLRVCGLNPLDLSIG